MALSWVSVEFPVTFISETLGSINVFGTKVPCETASFYHECVLLSNINASFYHECVLLSTFISETLGSINVFGTKVPRKPGLRK